MVGRNGEGKTTLLRILAGRLDPDGGSVSMPRGATRGPARPAAAARHGPDAGAVRRRGHGAGPPGRGRPGRPGGPHGRRRPRRRGDGGVRGGAGAPRAGRRLRLARLDGARAARSRHRRGGAPAAARRLLGRRAHARVAGALAGVAARRAAAGRAHEPPRHRGGRVAGAHDRARSTPPWCSSPTTAGSWSRWRPACWSSTAAGRSTGRWATRRSGASGPSRSTARAPRRSSRRRRSPAWSGSSRAGGRARRPAQAASRQKQLDRIVRVEAPRRQSHLAFGFPKAERSGRVVIEVDGLDVEVPGRRLISGAGFTLERGQRLAVVAPNGAGKTTLLETLIGERPPARGRVTVGHRVSPAYFSQHGEDLDDARTVVETVLIGERPDADPGPHPARRLPLLRRGGGRAGGPPVGRRAPAAVAGLADREGRQPAGAGRADEPPGHREPGGAGGGARRLRRHRRAGLPRPRPDRHRRDPHAGPGGRAPR